MNCINCNTEVNVHSRVNQSGDLFCGDDCYYDYLSKNEASPDDCSHPYIDHYELIRSNYIDWIEHWESHLVALSGKERILTSTDMLDTIDEVFEEDSIFYNPD